MINVINTSTNLYSTSATSDTSRTHPFRTHNLTQAQHILFAHKTELLTDRNRQDESAHPNQLQGQIKLLPASCHTIRNRKNESAHPNPFHGQIKLHPASCQAFNQPSAIFSQDTPLRQTTVSVPDQAAPILVLTYQSIERKCFKTTSWLCKKASEQKRRNYLSTTSSFMSDLSWSVSSS